MATIQQSIEIKVPVHTAYNQLTQFEDYPRFMEEVETVEQLDDTHLHWRMSNSAVEWDAEITEQEPDRCIAWHNISGPTNAGKLEVQSTGPDTSLVTFTLEAEQEPMANVVADSEEEIKQRVKQDLARLKDFIETRGSETGAWRGEVHDAQVTKPDTKQGQQGMPTSSASYAAGAENLAGNEDVDAGSDGMNSGRSTQSDSSLSRSSSDDADDERFSVAEEMNPDQQSDTLRRAGQGQRDDQDRDKPSASDANDGSMRPNRQQTKDDGDPV